MDNILINNTEYLTRAAKTALNEVTEEISSRILEIAVDIAHSRNTAEIEISLRDIIEAKESFLESRIKIEKSRNRKRRLAIFITLAGAVYAFAGVFLYIYQSEAFDLKSQPGLMIFFIGIMILLSGVIYTQFVNKLSIKERPIAERNFLYENQPDYEIVQRWQIIEKLTSDIMRESGLTENKSRSVNSIIEFLATQFETKKDAVQIKQFLTIRNKILHELYQPSRTEKAELINFSNYVIKRLEEIRK